MKKYLIENDEIVKEVTLQSLVEASNYPYSAGWRDEKRPDMTEPWHQELGEKYYDAAIDLVTWRVIEKQINIEELYNKRLEEWSLFKKEWRKEIVELFMEEIVLNTLPNEVKQFVSQLSIRSSEIEDELNGFLNTGNLERLTNYSFYTEETAQLKAHLESLKQ